MDKDRKVGDEVPDIGVNMAKSKSKDERKSSSRPRKSGSKNV